MKKVEVEKLVSRMLIITAVIGCIMFGTWLIQQGYYNYYTVLAMPIVMNVVSAVFVLCAVVCIVFGVKKNPNLYKFASLFAALAVFSMLLKINYEIKALEVVAGKTQIKFFPTSLCLLMCATIAGWFYTIVKIVRN